MKKQFKQHNRLLAIFLAFALTLPLSACGGAPSVSGGSSSAAAAGSQDTDDRVPVPEDAPWKNRDHESITVNSGFALGMTGIANQFAIKNGWYEDAGIVLNQVDIDNPVSAFGSGDIDIADGDPGTYVPAIVNKVPMKIISNMWRNRGAFWIIGNNDIKSWEDLKGKKVGTAAATGGMKLTLMETLSKNGVDPEKDVELVANGVRQEAYATLTSGEVDATVIHQPFATLAEKEGTGHVLAKTWEFIPDYTTGVLVASNRLIEEQPEAIERILEVYYYANEYCKNNFDVFIPWAAEYLNLDEATTKETIESEIVLWENDPIVDIARLQVTEDLLYKYGMQKESFDVGEDVVDNRFAEKAAQDLGLGKYAAK